MVKKDLVLKDHTEPKKSPHGTHIKSQKQRKLTKPPDSKNA